MAGYSKLAPLAAQFDEWRAGWIKASELSHQVYQFDKGPAHETYNFYNLMDQEFVLARAVVEGLLTEAEIPEEVWAHIGDMVRNLRRYRDHAEEK
jgi:hypothetical protein